MSFPVDLASEPQELAPYHPLLAGTKRSSPKDLGTLCCPTVLYSKILYGVGAVRRPGQRRCGVLEMVGRAEK